MTRLRTWSVVLPPIEDMRRARHDVEDFTGIGLCLAGIVYNDPRFRDGDHIRTSRIVKNAGRVVWTERGTVYTLEGEPDPHWVAYLNECGYKRDSRNPIRVYPSFYSIPDDVKAEMRRARMRVRVPTLAPRIAAVLP